MPGAPHEFAFLRGRVFTTGIRESRVSSRHAARGRVHKPRRRRCSSTCSSKRRIRGDPRFRARGCRRQPNRMKASTVARPTTTCSSRSPCTRARPCSRSRRWATRRWIPTEKHTLKSKEHANVFAHGDARISPRRKRFVASLPGRGQFENVLRHLDGREPLPAFDGHSNCFIETGHGKAMLIDSN